MGARIFFAIGSVVVNTIAAVVSVIVFLLTKLGEAVIWLAEVAACLKPSMPGEAS